METIFPDDVEKAAQPFLEIGTQRMATGTCSFSPRDFILRDRGMKGFQ